MAKFSTGLRNGMLNATGLTEALNLGFIKIYSGTPPADADAAATGTLLTTISVSGGGTGLGFGTPSGGVLTKNTGQVWSGTNVASGTAAYYRFVAAADTGALSTTAPRIQGTVATAGADMNLSSTSLTSGAVQTLDNWSVALPTL